MNSSGACEGQCASYHRASMDPEVPCSLLGCNSVVTAMGYAHSLGASPGQHAS
jgi:hypothetical protein